MSQLSRLSFSNEEAHFRHALMLKSVRIEMMPDKLLASCRAIIGLTKDLFR